ncbi:MFS transporter [Marinigracilibium pacificum]|uniref:SLC45 family MFS transporter n=1 Tax=Marinigracilibium pacificum TaxID=2729599 RepID=A0A848J7G6_9BACT|nr:MFS transporter [Marinigracilibium pacificum]NMM50430.1 SLC45 family MFS transporter [Marinigracilibium pacificum]
MSTGTKKMPKLSFLDIWMLSFGFLGIQFGFALQNANASRILQTFGADVEHLSWFWLAAPLTGLIVQPIVGHYSDRTWNKLGRRKPYFLSGAILASIALILMPNAGMFAAFLPAMFVGAGFLMIMDASFNIAMEPFRALVADMLPSDQRTLGFSVQTTLIGIGAVIGSWLPYMLKNWFRVDAPVGENEIPMNVVYSFFIGSAVLITSVLITISGTKEYDPEEYESYHGKAPDEGENLGFFQIFKDFANIPNNMWRLGLVQFFSWFGLFSMWVFTTPAVAQHIYGLPISDTKSEMYNNAGDWVGVIFGVYNFVSAIYAFFFLPWLAKVTSRKMAHAISLICGAIGFFSIYFITNEDYLIISMIGIGMAWASILAMPYAILAGSIPSGKMGVFMGIFNFFIVIPQIVNGIFGGPLIKNVFGEQAIYALIIAGFSFVLAAVLVVFVKDEDEPVADDTIADVPEVL